MGLSIAERLENGPVLGAEGYVFELERRGYIKAGDASESAAPSRQRAAGLATRARKSGSPVA
jgi:hypothetical protein